MAMGMLAVLSIAVVLVVDSSTSNARSSTRSGGDKVAFALAEAGINNAMAVLNLPTNNALKQSTLVACTGPESGWNKSDYEGGYVVWCGTFNASGAYWDVTAIGYVRNPFGTKIISRKIGARVVVTPTTTQPLNNPAWNYLFNRSTALTCDMTLANNVGGSSRLYVSGDLCLSNNAGVTSAELIVHGNLSLGNNAFVGASTSLDTRVPTHVGGICQYGGGVWTSPNCGGNQDSRRIYSKIVPGNTIGVSTTPPIIGAPVSDFATWYSNAMPGPTQSCTASSGTVPVFDNDGIRNNSVTSVFELTPTTSYSCRVGPAESPSGELTWNATTRVLTVSGTIFIDGSLKMTNGFLNQYNGQATVYLSGTFYAGNNTKMCGGVSGSNCDFGAWNPNTEMMTITTDGTGGLAGTGNGILMDNNSVFQGALYATNNIQYTNNSRSDGPMVANELIFANNVQNDSFPTITVVPVGQPGNPAVYAQPNPPQMFSG